jgi:adenosylhomocysteinase
MPEPSIIRDASLATVGNQKIDWVERHAPVLARLSTSYLADGTFRGLTIGMTIPIGPKVSFFATALKRAGATVVVTAPDPSFVQDDAAAALASRGVTVYGSSAQREEDVLPNFERVLAHRPDVVLDDRAQFVSMLLTSHKHLQAGLRGASEQTTTGVTRLAKLESENQLTFPVLAANDARCKHMFDNRYGTGQSAISAIIDTTNLFLGGKSVVVVGYGWVGRGVALRARGMHSDVIVTERDPVRALEAYADGFRVMTMGAAASIGDVFISCTGVDAVIGDAHFRVMKDNALLANAGAVDTEVEVNQLASLAVRRHSPRKNVESFELSDGRQLHVLGGGRVVNVAAAEGHPVEIMDLTYAVQAMGLYFLASQHPRLESRLYQLPDDLDYEIARTAARAYGVGVEGMTND